MIAEAPIAASSNVDGILNKIAAFVATAESAASDGLTWAEFGELMVSLLRLAVRLVDLLQVSGPEKKEIVLAAAAALFDSLADRCVPLLLWPVWGLVRSPVRALVMALASGAVEALLPLVRAS